MTSHRRCSQMQYRVARAAVAIAREQFGLCRRTQYGPFLRCTIFRFAVVVWLCTLWWWRRLQKSQLLPEPSLLERPRRSTWFGHTPAPILGT
jgi:hypothetical protein